MIGVGTMALWCLTNDLECCDEQQQQFGEWYFPNGSPVDEASRADVGSIYKDQGPSVVRLNQRNNSSFANGLYHCQILDNNGTNESIYVGIYQPGEGIMNNYSPNNNIIHFSYYVIIVLFRETNDRRL